MIEVLRRSVISQRIGLTAVSVGMFAVSLLIVYTFDALGGAQSFEALLEMLPEAIKALMRAQGGIATDASGYLAADYRHPIYLIAVGAFIVASTTGAVAREIERGSILMLLSAPIDRWRFLLAKLGALLFGIVIILLATLLGTWVGIAITGTDDVGVGLFLRIQVVAFALAFAIAGIGLLISSLSSDGGQAMGITTGIIVVMYFIDFLALIWSAAEPLGPLSIYYYYDPLAISRQSGIPVLDVAVLLGVGAASTTAAFAAFLRRDIAR
jgi:ABC-2 type transport system permease protein